MFWTIFLGFGCVDAFPDRDDSFPDNPLHDYDGDNLTEQQGDCDDLDPNVQNGPWYFDADGDGFGDPEKGTTDCERDGAHVPNGLDCNDNDVGIYPGNARFEDEEACVQDIDGDGYGSMVPTVPADFGTDCDDASADVNPASQEVCDGFDNDCNGEIDEYNGIFAPAWYGDNDGDGYGDPEVVTHACSAPEFYVDNSFDCDDGNPSIYPNAPELCMDGDLDGDGVDDAIDNNCNGVADENSALDVKVWFADADNDGFGSPSAVTYACEWPSGFVENADDCNDNNMSIHPDAEEVCNGQDDDCDTLFDEGSPTFSPIWYLDADGDGFGDSASSHQACYVPSGHVSNFGDCDDSDAGIYPNSPEYCDGIDNDCDGSIDDNALDSQVFYLDADGDGRGGSTETLISCVTTLPDGYSAFDDDCDDNDPDRAPHFPELCTDTIDENCDGDPTFAAVDLNTYFADSDMDGYGNPVLSIQLCEQPPGYVVNFDDCNDTDADVQPFMPESAELCNGKIDRCETTDLEVVGEMDLDGDGYVSCDLDVEPLLWEDPALLPLGGGDCDDANADRYPGAPEICNGVFENCSNVNFLFQSAPDLETDNDGDGYVECTYYASVWSSTTVVSGGDDCDDSSDLTYVGAAANHPNLCAQDADFDGEPDCNLTGITQDYGCDYGVVYPDGTGPDFRLINGGMDPLNRYELTYDYYVMTTEVSIGMFETVLGGTDTHNVMSVGDSNTTWRLFANQLSMDTGFETCYESDGTFPKPEFLYEIAACEGYRLPTEAEWDYAARAGTTSDFWTGTGPENGGTTSDQGCDYDAVIIDGNLNPHLRDYAWFCGNTNTFQPIAQLLPNGFGLYDVYGNRSEMTNDMFTTYHPCLGCSSFPIGTFQNPNGYYHPTNMHGNVSKGAYDNTMSYNTPVWLMLSETGNSSNYTGARLVRTVF